MSKIIKQEVLINDEYLKEYSLFPANYDLTEIRNFIPLAEQIHILPILGQALFDELLNQVINNNLTQENSTLLLEVYKVEGIAVLMESLPFTWAHLSEKGITLGKSDNSDSLQNKDLNYILTNIKSKLIYLKENLKKFLDKNAVHYPLFKKECPMINKNNMKFTIYRTPKDNIDLI